jgi:hypothetical protein
MPTKVKKSTELDNANPSVSAPVPVVYADRIINLGLGVAVSRLTLGLEVGENNILPSTQIVMPTPALFEAIEFMAKHLMTDAARKPVIDALDKFRSELVSAV